MSTTSTAPYRHGTGRKSRVGPQTIRNSLSIYPKIEPSNINTDTKTILTKPKSRKWNDTSFEKEVSRKTFIKHPQVTEKQNLTRKRFLRPVGYVISCACLLAVIAAVVASVIIIAEKPLDTTTLLASTTTSATAIASTFASNTSSASTIIASSASASGASSPSTISVSLSSISSTSSPSTISSSSPSTISASSSSTSGTSSPSTSSVSSAPASSTLSPSTSGTSSPSISSASSSSISSTSSPSTSSVSSTSASSTSSISPSTTSTKSTASTSTTSTSTATVVTTPNSCGNPVSVGSNSSLFSKASSISSYTCKYYEWISLTTGTTTLAFQFRNDASQWYMDDVSVSNGTTEMLVNGGFESGSLLPAWITSTPNGNCSTSVNGAQVITSSVHTGSYCLKDACGAVADQISQSFTAIMGQPYFISFWIKGSGSGSGITVSVFLS